MNLTEVAKNLLEGKSCITCHDSSFCSEFKLIENQSCEYWRDINYNVVPSGEIHKMPIDNMWYMRIPGDRWTVCDGHLEIVGNIKFKMIDLRGHFIHEEKEIGRDHGKECIVLMIGLTQQLLIKLDVGRIAFKGMTEGGGF